MRQSIKDEDYSCKYIEETKYIINRSLDWLNKDLPEDKIVNVRRGLASNYLKDAISKYTFNYKLENILTPLISAIDFTSIGWKGFWKLKNDQGVELDQYILSAYDEMIWMLSLGFLLNISKEDFKKLVEVIDRDGVKDYLFEYIIKAKLPSRESINEESYKEFFGVPDTFQKLRQSIFEPDKNKAKELIKEFIEKDWYKNHKDVGWYNSHKSKHNTYFGYWSFETAAIVKIMDIDDSEFKDCQYYPDDLVHNAL